MLTERDEVGGRQKVREDSNAWGKRTINSEGKDKLNRIFKLSRNNFFCEKRENQTIKTSHHHKKFKYKTPNFIGRHAIKVRAK